MSPVITVITPTRNRRQVLLRAISSVQRQDLKEYQHLIIDDGSTDGTADEVRAIQDARIRLIVMPEGRGANHARNVGIAAAGCSVITFLDSDDEYLPDRLSSTIRLFEENPEAAVHISSFKTFKGTKHYPCINPDVSLSGEQWEEVLIAHAVFIAGSAITIRRHTLDTVGGFDPEISRMQDRDLLLRLSRREGVRLTSEVNWIKYRSHDSISAPRAGYLVALSQLFSHHEEAALRYRSVVGYLVARDLLSSFLQGEWNHLFRGFSENRKLETFRFSLLSLFNGYRSGKQRRRDLRRSLRSGNV